MNPLKKIVNIANRLTQHTYWFNHIVFPGCRKFWTLKEFNLKIVNLGSSSAFYGFDYSSVDNKIKAANWALAPQTFVGDLQILRNYYSYLKNDATVIIPICPFSSLGGGDDHLSDRYYTILNIASIPHASYKKKIEVNRLFGNPILYYPIFEILNTIYRLFKKKPQTLSNNEMIRDANNRINNWKKEFSIISFDKNLSILQKDLMQQSERTLKEIVLFCKERNLTPVVVIPPASEILLKQIDLNVRNVFIYSFLKNAITNDIKVLDYFDDSDFHDSKLFRDSFLLNSKGAKLFTKKVLNDIDR